jgi:hypothetical protein
MKNSSLLNFMVKIVNNSLFIIKLISLLFSLVEDSENKRNI